MSPMQRTIVSRVAQIPIILFAVYTLTFALAWLIPGNPLEKAEGRRPPAAIAEAMQSQWNLDDPWTFYWSYLGDITGVNWLLGNGNEAVIDFGPSLRHENWSVNEIITGQLPVSMTVGIAAILLALLIGVSAGTLGGLRPGTWIDRVTGSVSVIGVSVPAFVIGTALLLVGGVWLQWFPVGGWGHTFAPRTSICCAQPSLRSMDCPAHASGCPGGNAGGLHPNGSRERCT